MWNVPKWTDDVCSGLNKTKVTDVGGSNHKLNFASIKNWVKHQNHPLILCFYAHFSRLTHQLLFHVCRTWGSWMLCLSACSSKKSNMYLMASGRALPRWAVLKMVSKRSSTNFCNVPWGRGDQKWITLSLSIANILLNMETRRLQDQHLLYTGHKPTTEERNKLWSFLQFWPV